MNIRQLANELEDIANKLHKISADPVKQDVDIAQDNKDYVKLIKLAVTVVKSNGSKESITDIHKHLLTMGVI